MDYYWTVPYLVPHIIAHSLSFTALLLGSMTDLRTREVPDWINYGLIASGVALNLLFSIIYRTPYFILGSLAGLLIFFCIAYVMFYAGQWGGGDSKMLMGLGAVIGLEISLKSQHFLLAFLINTLLIGAIYGLLWSFYLVLRNRKRFWKEFIRILAAKKIAIAKKFILGMIILILVALLFINVLYIRLMVLSVAFLVLTSFYLWVFVKAIEKSCMHKLVEPSKLTEGDWIVKNIYVDGKFVTGPKDLGISKSRIRKLVEFYKKGKVRKILIKEGIPFVPSFLMAYIFTLIFGNVILMLL